MNSHRAFLFPGQGAQVLGMAVDLVEAFPEARRVFETGREILGKDILAVCRDGPEAELNSTRMSQPAIFLHSMAMLEVLGKAWGAPGPFCRGVPACGTAGLSLGEYSALVFAEAIEFEEATRIVGLRGELMQRACEASRGTMASVLGMAAGKVEEVVEATRAAGFQVGVANYNSPEQTVISGEVAAVKEATSRLEAAGARRVLPLRVAGAFHSPAMAPATRELEPHLSRLGIRKPRLPFYSNVTGARLEEPDAIREALVRQVESPVRWNQICQALAGDPGRVPMEGALELGPGKVLQGLMRSVRRDVEVVSLGTVADLERARELAPAVNSLASRAR